MTWVQVMVRQRGRWVLAGILALASLPVLFLPVLSGGEVITWPSIVAADGLLALGVLVGMKDARRQTFAWMAALGLPVFLLAAIVHNVEYGLTGAEEPTFILAAILGGPTLLLAGVGGMVWAGVRDRHFPPSSRKPTARAT